MSLAIGELARRTGLSVDALRYYERLGLLPGPERNAGGHRRYDEGVVAVLDVITTLRAAGFSLAQVGLVLGAKQPGTSARERADAARAAIGELEADLERQSAAVRAARRVLRDWRAELDAGEPYSTEPLSC